MHVFFVEFATLMCPNEVDYLAARDFITGFCRGMSSMIAPK